MYRSVFSSPLAGERGGFARAVIATAIGLLLLFGLGVSISSANVPRAYAGIVIDAKTGNTLYSYAADSLRYPASVTKVMTLYLLFQELEAGRMTLNTRLNVSEHAAAAVPTKLYVRPGSTIRVEDAIKSLVTLSANDVSRVIAENIAGTESRFAERMTSTARALGMSRTTYANASGLPSTRQVTTVRDQARLGMAIYQHFPTYYEYFQIRSFTYNGNTHGNHNRLLGQNGVDGIKTGYTRASGYNLLTAARANNRHIVVAAFGFSSSASRNNKVRELVEEYMPNARRGSYWQQALIDEVSGSTGNVFSVATATPVYPMPRPSQRNPSFVQLVPAPQTVMVASISPTEATSIVAPQPAPIAAAQPAPIAAAQPAPMIAIAPVRAPQPAPNTLNAQALALSGQTASLGVAPTNLVPITATMATTQASGVPDLTRGERTLDAIGSWLSESFQLGPRTTSQIPAVTPVSLLPPAEIGSIGANQDMAIDLMTSGSIAPAQPIDSGWVVQIGAAPSPESAENLLETAADNLSSLSSFRSYVEQYENVGVVYYRARFAGFANRLDAMSMCAQIKEINMSCLAVES